VYCLLAANVRCEIETFVVVLLLLSTAATATEQNESSGALNEVCHCVCVQEIQDVLLKKSSRKIFFQEFFQNIIFLS